MGVAQANLMGNVHGGEIMKLIDTAAGIAASRHAGGPAVTVSLDQMSFLSPVRVGNVVFVHASVDDVGRTSMDVSVGLRCYDQSAPFGRDQRLSPRHLYPYGTPCEPRPDQSYGANG